MKYQYIILSDAHTIYYPRPMSVAAGVKRQWHFQQHYGETYKQSIVSPEMWIQLKRDYVVQLFDTTASKPQCSEQETQRRDDSSNP